MNQEKENNENEVATVEVDDPCDLTFNVIHGFKYPGFIPPVAVFDKLRKEIRFKDGDVVMVSYPKTGCHWGFGYLGMLLTGSRKIIQIKEKALENGRDKDFVENRERPRIFNTCSPYHHLIDDLKENKNIKILLLIRNPKDTAVSYYHFLKKWVYDNKVFSGTFSTFFERWIQGEMCYGSWFDYYQPYFENLTERDNVLIVQYEKLKMNFVESLRDIAAFLELKVDEEFLRHVASETSIDGMKAWASAVDADRRDGHMEVDYYRKGIVGEWRSIMSEEESRRVDKMLEAVAPVLRGFKNIC